jgi:Co/Zn/Cd efflux system component
MYVDVVTYLFNFLAERLKHGDSSMSSRKLRLRRLYLELIPPAVSLVTLIAVTVMALREAIASLISTTPVENDPNINLMLLFSGLNMLLDLLNVGCFARVDQAVGLDVFIASSGTPYPSDPTIPKDESVVTEKTPLTTSDDERTESIASDELNESIDSNEATGISNLNMCSAWTVRLSVIVLVPISRMRPASVPHTF